MTRRRNTFIVFEGIDGSGKSDQLERAEAWLSPNVACAPKTPMRRLYRELTSDESGFPDALTSVFLALSDYAAIAAFASLERDDRPLLAHRFVYSTLADGIALGLDASDLVAMAKPFDEPDLVVFIDTPASVAADRKPDISLAESGGPGRSSRHIDPRARFIEFQEAVGKAYREILPALVSDERLLILDGTGAPEALHSRIAARIAALLPSVAVATR